MYQDPTLLAFQEAGHKAAQHLTKRLRSFAAAHGWGETSNHLHVSYHEGEYVPRYPDQIADKVLDLEFGTQERPPKPALRQFMNRAHAWSDEVFNAMEVPQ